MRAALLEAAGQPLAICDDIEIRDPGPGQVVFSLALAAVVIPAHRRLRRSSSFTT